ncbi:unnamed protein product, partial [Discosporangium mesarthrocarpum]
IIVLVSVFVPRVAAVWRGRKKVGVFQQGQSILSVSTDVAGYTDVDRSDQWDESQKKAHDHERLERILADPDMSHALLVFSAKCLCVEMVDFSRMARAYVTDVRKRMAMQYTA